jgi:hypothetical protein
MLGFLSSYVNVSDGVNFVEYNRVLGEAVNLGQKKFVFPLISAGILSMLLVIERQYSRIIDAEVDDPAIIDYYRYFDPFFSFTSAALQYEVCDKDLESYVSDLNCMYSDQ